VSHRFSGRVGALVLGSLAVVTACGSRDNLFVQDDEINLSGGQAGTLSFSGSGNANAGGRAGSANVGGRAGSIGIGGSLSIGGRVGVAGSPSAGFHAGGSGGSSVAFGGSGGFGNVGNISGIGGVAGAPGDWCDACLALNPSANPCAAFTCDFQHLLCTFVSQNEGLACSDGNLCDQAVCRAGQCLAETTTTCPETQCEAALCDPKSGSCSLQKVLDGPPCDDGDPCTVNDQCLQGICSAGTAVGCQNNDKCCPAGCSSNQDNDCAPSVQLTLNASDRGWYENNGFHNSINKNTFTGASQGNTYNSYFNFDLSQVSATITSAQLVLVEETYYGPNAAENVSVWDVSESASTVSTSPVSVVIYQDLQSGNQYGTVVTTANLTGSSIFTSLNPKAVAALNAARGGSFSLGLHIDTLPGRTADEGVRFSADSEPRANQLILNF
jgi:hypothetical protein